MKRGCFIVILLLISVCAAEADTTWVQGGSISGTWTAAHSPYMIQGNTTIATGDSLSITPGVCVNFAGPYSFKINGWLTARGTEADSIIFTTDTLANPDRWRGLRFIYADNTSRMEYCVVENGGNSFGGGIYCENTFCRFLHCRIQYNGAFRGGGAYIRDGSSVFDGCVIECNSAGTGGGLCLENAVAWLTSCHISANDAYTNGAGIAMNSAAAELKFSSVSYNRNFYSTQNSAAISCSSGTVTLIRCTVAANEAYPLDQGGAGMYLLMSVVDINSTIFAFNDGPALQFFDYSVGFVRYSDFFGQILTAGDPPIGFGQITRYNANADFCDDDYNILLDPLIADISREDFHLQETSPCIHAGDPALPRDPDGTAADIGEFYFHRPYVTPTPFALLYPQNGDTLIDTNRVRFGWSMSTDGDRGDTVTYTLYLHSGDSTWTFPVFVDSQHIVDLSALTLDLTESLEWWVTAHSPQPDTSVECQDRFTAHLVSAGTSVPENNLPHEFALYESFPNPFNAVTAIRFEVPHAARVTLKVFDILGREAAVLQDGFTEAGTHRVLFDAGSLTSGVYYCRMTADDFAAVKKLLLVK